MKRAVVILNPVSGTGRGAGGPQREAALARDVLASEGLAVDVRFTEGPGDGQRLAREAMEGGASLVVAWGGDGTINEIGGVLAFGRVPLGIVPAGSGNGLARDLGLPLDPRQALVVAARGSERVIDAGELGGSLFFNVAGIGLDARIAALFADRSGRRGLLAYAWITAREVLRYRAMDYRVVGDGVSADHHALIIAFANSRQYGNGAQIAPAACLDDGRVELVVVEGQSLLSMVTRMPALFRGTLRDAPGLSMRAVATARVEAAVPIPFHVDGEPRLGPTVVECRVHAGALAVRVPLVMDELAMAATVPA
ncbi:MAG: diacylglycerol kinase family protein [Vicinamibacterales bacterium]